MSFFDEDDEPRTRVRPRRAATSRGGASSPDRQTVLIRQLVLFGGFILFLALAIFVIDGCRDSARESALKDYNRDVATIVRDSDSQVGKPFFDLHAQPEPGRPLDAHRGLPGAGRDRATSRRSGSTRPMTWRPRSARS